MGRRLSTRTVDLSIKVYKLLKSVGEPISTKEILEKFLAHEKEIEYLKIYRCLRLLSRKGVIKQLSQGRTSFWTVVKEVDEETLRKILRSKP